jgi:hypothetical protein
MVSEFPDGFDIAAIAAAIIEERLSAPELPDFEQCLYRLGDLAANESCLVAVDFLFRCGDFRERIFGGFNKSMALEAKAALCECALPIQSETDSRGVIQQTGHLFLAGEFGELAVERVLQRQEGFLAMEDRWICPTAVIVASGFS